MQVSEPIDHVEFSDALEQIIMKAKENNCDEYEILRQLEAHTEKFVDNEAQYKQTFD